MELLAYTIVGTVIGTLLAIEAKAWLPYLSAGLVRSTLRKMPDALDHEFRSRWSEEIESDLASYDDRPLGGFLFALRLRRRGGKRLAAELALEQTLSTPEPVTGSRAAVRSDGVTLRRQDGSWITYTADGDGTLRKQEFDANGNVLETWISKRVELDSRLDLGEAGER